MTSSLAAFEALHMSQVPDDADTERLIDKNQLRERVPLSFPTIWTMMREGRFPAARIVGGKSMWLESEVAAWIASRPQRKYKRGGSDCLKDNLPRVGRAGDAPRV
jgi:predicted DNA-binding transcriptional regulator AlpA